jgi:hypothetical protein
MRLKDNCIDGMILDYQLANGTFPIKPWESNRNLYPNMLDAFRDFEMAAYNNDLKDNITVFSTVLEFKISKCIILADTIYENYLNEIRNYFNEMKDEDIFYKTSWDDKRLPLKQFQQSILNHLNILVELYTSKNYMGEIIEAPWQLYIFNDYNRGELKYETIGKFRAPKDYFTVKYEIVDNIRERALLDKYFP